GGRGTTRPGNCPASLSKSGRPHPPRSNPPLRSSSGPPSPCIAPSTETFVMVVSFMVTGPFSLGLSSFDSTGGLGTPLVGGLSPSYEHLSPDPTPPPGFPSRTCWYAGCER